MGSDLDWLGLIAALLASAPITAPATIYLEPGPHAASFKAQLDRELPPGSIVSRYAADVSVALHDRGTELVIEARGRDDNLILRRQIPFEEDVAPALRVAALLISELTRRAPETKSATAAAVRDEVPVAVRLDTAAFRRRPVDDLAPPIVSTPSVPIEWYVSISAAGVWWRSPALSPEPGLGLAIAAKREVWRFSVEVLGMCCARDTEDVSATALEMAVFVGVARDLFTFDGGAFLFTASAGGSWIQYTAAASSLAGPGTPVSDEVFQASLILAPAMSATLWDNGALEVRAGARFVANPLVISPPSVAGDAALHAGFVAPFVQVALPFKLF